jgi:hypothetical protein
LSKNGLGSILGDFFSKLIWSPWCLVPETYIMIKRVIWLKIAPEKRKKEMVPFKSNETFFRRLRIENARIQGCQIFLGA